jgi:hypothetical protein
MILQLNAVQSEQPKISLNQLAEFPFASENKKRSILRNQKFRNNICAPYYTAAFHAILRSFKDGCFDEDLLLAEAYRISILEVETDHRATKRDNNVKAIERLIEIGASANPTPGIHAVVHQTTKLLLDGVLVSVRPEIVTENHDLSLFAFTKLRFSKSKVSADAQEIALLVLMHFGQRQYHEGLTFSMEESKLVDCFSKTVTAGHTLGRHRDQQLHDALAEIRILWPQIFETN